MIATARGLSRRGRAGQPGTATSGECVPDRTWADPDAAAGRFLPPFRFLRRTHEATGRHHRRALLRPRYGRRPSDRLRRAAGNAVIGGIYVDDGDTASAFGVARLLPDGTPDPDFVGDGVTAYDFFYDAAADLDGASAVALHTDGAILLGGSYPVADESGALRAAMSVLRLRGGTPFTDGFESGSLAFWRGGPDQTLKRPRRRR